MLVSKNAHLYCYFVSLFYARYVYNEYKRVHLFYTSDSLMHCLYVYYSLPIYSIKLVNIELGQ